MELSVEGWGFRACRASSFRIHRGFGVWNDALGVMTSGSGWLAPKP